MSVFDDIIPSKNNDPLQSTPVENKIDILSGVSSFPKYAGVSRDEYSPYMENVNYLYSDINEDRARAQSVGAQLIDGLVKGTGLAATTFATTFTSLPYGIGAAIEQAGTKALDGDDKSYSQIASQIYDNPISRSYDQFSKYMEETFPNYYTREAQESGAFSPKNWFTMNFLADKLLKNAGFTVGAIASGSLVAKGFGAIGKMAMAGSYADELAATERLAGEFVGQGLKEGEAWSKALNQVGKGIKNLNGVQTIGGALVSAGNEATFEALQTKQSTFARIKEDIDKKYQSGELSSEQYRIELEKADDLASSAGNVDYIANLGILAGSDLIQFRKFFSGFKNERKTLGEFIRKEGTDYIGSYSTRLERTLPYFKGLVTEAGEEGLQQFFQTGSQDFFARRYDNNSGAKLSDVFESIGVGLQNTFGTKEGLESMLLGALTGIISGGITGEIRDEVKGIKDRDAAIKLGVNTLNNIHAQDIFNKNIDKIGNAVRSISIQRDMDNAVKSDDVYQYQNLKHDLFKSYVLSRITTGKYDAMMDELDGLTNLPKEELEKTFGIDPTLNQKNTVEYITKLKQEATRLGELWNNLDTRFPTVSTGTKEMLFDYASNLGNTSKRLDELYLKLAKSPEVLQATTNYVSDRTKGNEVILNDAIKKDGDKIAATGEDVRKMVDDYTQLLDRRKEFSEKYQHTITDDGIREKEDLVNNLKKTAEDIVLRNNADKFFGRGQNIVDKESNSVVGKLYKVGKEFRLYKEFSEKGSPIGKYETVNPATKEFQDKYDVDSTQDLESLRKKRDLGTIETQRLVRKLNSFTNANELRQYIEDKIKPLNLSNEDLVLKEARKIYTKLTGKTLQRSDLTNQVNPKWAKYKGVMMDNLYNMIKRRESLLRQKQTKFAETEPLYFLKEELKSLEEQLAKEDGRSTEKSKKVILEHINKLQDEIISREQQIQDMLDEQSKLEKEIDYLNKRLQEEFDKEETTNLKERLADTRKEIEQNKDIILAWKNFINECKKLMNNLLQFFHLGKVYNEQTKEDILKDYAYEVDSRVKDLPDANKKFGKQMAFAKAKLDNYIKGINEGKSKFVATGEKISQATRQIESFEKANRELEEKMELISEEMKELNNLVRQQAITVKATPIVKGNKITSKKGISPEEDVNDSNLAGETVNESTKDSVVSAFFQSAKRTISSLFSGLAGRHYITDDRMNPNESQRRYYRFTNRMNLNKGYKVKLSLGEVREEYKNEWDRQTIIATVVNNKGEYVDEFGKVTTDPNQYVYTALPVSVGTKLESFQPEGMSDDEYNKKVQVEKETHLLRREWIIRKLQKEQDVLFPVVGKSLGVARTVQDEFGKEAQNRPLKDIGIPLNELEIRVATGNTITFDNNQTVTTRPGFVYAQDSAGNKIPLHTRKLTQDEIDLVVKLFKYFIQNHKISKSGINATGAGVVYITDKSGKRTTILKPNSKEAFTIFDALQNITFWTGNNLKPDVAEQVRKGKMKYEDAIADKNNLINKNDSTVFGFIKSNIPGGELRLGNSRIPLFAKSVDGVYVENAALEGALKDFLTTRYVQIDSKLLNSNQGVLKIDDVNLDKGTVNVNTKYSKNGGYRQSILDNDSLETSVISKGTKNAGGEEVPQFSSQYAIIDYNEESIPKPSEKAEEISEEDVVKESTKTGEGLTEEEIKAILGNQTLMEDDFDSFDPEDDVMARRARETSEETINIEKAKKNLERLLGTSIELHTVKTLLSGKNWGEYRNKMIYLYENAEVGTEYHEAFHAVMDVFLTNEQKQSLLKEYNAKNGTNLNDRDTEEKLAEDFRDFMLGRPISYFGTKQKSLFQRIIDFIKKVVLGKEDIQNLFESINKGDYAKKEFRKSSDGVAHKSSAIKGLSVKDTSEIIDGVNALFFSELFKSSTNIETLFSKEDNSKLINGIYDTVLNRVKAYTNRLLEQGRIEDARKVTTAILNWNAVKQIHRKNVSQFNVEFTDEWIEEQGEDNRVKDSGSVVPTESLKFSNKLNASKNIKLIVGTLSMVDSNGRPVLNSLGLPYNVDFGKTFATLQNRLSNLTSWEDMVKKMQELSVDIPSMNTLLNRLGNNKPFDGLTSEQFINRVQFIQTFAKNSNTFLMDIVKPKGDRTVINANINSFERRRLDEWNRSTGRLEGTSKYYKTIKGKKYYNLDEINKLNAVKSPEEVLDILRILGVQFSNEERIPSEDLAELTRRTNAILNTVKKGDGNLIFSKNVDTSNDLKFLMGLEARTAVNNVENSLFNIDGELVYGETLNNYMSLVLNAINNDNVQSLENLFQVLPHLKYVESSLILNNLFDSKGKKKSINFYIHDGSKEQESEVSKKHDKLKTPDQLAIRFNQGLKGIYNLIRPADNSIERFIELGTLFDSTDIATDDYTEAFIDYLRAEMNSSVQSKSSAWTNLSKNYTHGIVIDAIKSQDKGLHGEIIKTIDGAEDVDVFIENHHELIEKAILDYVNQQVSDTTQLLIENKLVSERENGYNNLGIDSKDKFFTPEALRSIVKQYTVNSLTANIEQVKLLVGNPQFYKSVEDQFKRHSGMVGTKKISVIGEFIDRYIDKYLDRFSKFKQQYDENGNPIIKTAVVADIISISKYYDKYKELIGDKAEGYLKANEGDAQGYIHLSEYRRFLIRTGDWTFGRGSLEEKYQYEMGNRVYVDPQSGEQFDIVPERINKLVFNPLKPQYFGPMAEEGFIPGFYKLSVLPLIPSLVKEVNLQKLNNQMEQQSLGIVVFASGNKVGTKLNDKGVIQSLYNDKGEFAFDKDNLMTEQNTYYKYWGIQVDMGSKSKSKVISGTQMAKQVINGLFSMGTAKAMRFVTPDGKLTEKSSEETDKRVKEYLEANRKRIQLGLNSLVKDLGLRKEGGEYVVDNGQEFINKLQQEAIKRQLPDNIIEGIRFVTKNGIDVLPNREKLENILLAIADSTVISQKRFGSAKVQVSSALMEKGVRVTVSKRGKSYYTSSDLNFYEIKNGKVKSMEVMIPDYFKGKVKIGEKIDPRLLKLIGFRIPTQGLNSIESIVVKDFLSTSAGDIVVVPTELVVKAGSDFDIDKLNLYIPNFFFNQQNSPVYIDPKMTYNQYLMMVNERMLESDETTLTEDQFEKAKLENRMTELMDEFITSPDNVEQLLTPNDASGIKDEADYITWLESGKKGSFEEYKENKRIEEKNTSYNRMIETRYALDTTKRFLGGKSAVGITAVHSTFHILSQLENLYINRYLNPTAEKVEDMGSTKVNLPHNKTSVDTGEVLPTEEIALGGTESQSGENIPEALSQWINAAVDAAKDPFMFDLNANPATLNTILYLTMIGVPRRSISLFINQPIIKEYIRLQDVYESMLAEENKFKLFKEQIINQAKRKFNIKNSTPLFDETLNNEDLEEAIVDKGKDPILQNQVLRDFIRYQDTAKVLREAMSGITYDTSSAGKNTSEMRYKLESTQKVLDDGVIGNYDKLVDNGFVSPYYEATKEFKNLFKPYIPTLRNENLNGMFTRLIDIYLSPSVTVQQDDVVRVIDKFKNDFITYLVESYTDGTNPSLSSRIEELFVSKDSMAHRVNSMKEKYPNNMLLDALVPIFATDEKSLQKGIIDNVKVYATKLDSIESNQLTEDWDQLFNGNAEEQKFAEDLMQFIVLQSGLQNSPINFINLVPTEQYNRLVEKAIKTLDVQDNSFNDFWEYFFLSNYNDRNIVPRRKNTAFPFYIKGWNYTVNKDGSKTFEKFPTIARTSNEQIVNVRNMAIKDFRNNSTLNTGNLMNVNSGKISIEENINFNEEDINNLPECI